MDEMKWESHVESELKERIPGFDAKVRCRGRVELTKQMLALDTAAKSLARLKPSHFERVVERSDYSAERFADRDL